MTTKTTAIIGAVMLMATLMSACIDNSETVAETNTSIAPTPTPTPDLVIKEISTASPQAYIDKAYGDDGDYQDIFYKYTVSSVWRSANGSNITEVERENGVYLTSYNYDKWNQTVNWAEWMNYVGISPIGIYDRTETEYALMTGGIKTIIIFKACQKPGGDYLYVMIDCVRERSDASAPAPTETQAQTPVDSTPDKEYQLGDYTTIKISMSAAAKVYEGGVCVQEVDKKTKIFEVPYTRENWARPDTAAEFAQITGLDYSGIYDEVWVIEDGQNENRGSVRARWDTDNGYVLLTGTYSMIKKT